jgi:KDO2-lipid IV(A) lauroyltransferase
VSLASRGVVAAVRLAPRVPEGLVRAGAAVAADLTWWRHGSGVRRLEANLARVRPDLDATALRAVSRAGMRSYLRYYAEAFTLPGVSPERLDARVIAVGLDQVVAEIAGGRSVVLALGHQGNWDLAGAWATRHIAPVTTVAERLEPPEVFDAFLALRSGIGLNILPLDSGADVFRELVRTARAGGALIPLLADRDLTAGGLEVLLCGRPVRVAAGPAALAVTTGMPLFATGLRHVRLTGVARRAAGARWGVQMSFTRVEAPEGTPRHDLVRVLTQGWVDVVGREIVAHPAHWHMLQRLFVEDLDPDRLPVAGGGR